MECCELTSEYLAECWICSSNSIELIRPSTIAGMLSPEDFQITDKNYGSMGSIYRCQVCGFLQCKDIQNVVIYYEQMEDQLYTESEHARTLQATSILKKIMKHKLGGRFLDVGSGAGILMQEAKKHGFEVQGVEPSKWLHHKAVAKGLDVYQTTLPSPEIKGSYSVVSAIDVIEHVKDPVALLKSINELLDGNGVGCLVTPDVSSFAAWIMGWKWWHYRVAHIGYFNLETIDLALDKAGLERISTCRPCWYFSIEYLLERLSQYLPVISWLPLPKVVRQMIIPLNLLDSYLIIFKKKSGYE